MLVSVSGSGAVGSSAPLPSGAGAPRLTYVEPWRHCVGPAVDVTWLAVSKRASVSVARDGSGCTVSDTSLECAITAKSPGAW
jgi:hypothetical protein